MTVTVQIYPNSGGVSNGAWNFWHGTMTLAYPGQTLSDGSCAGGEWDVALASTGGTATA